MKDSWDKVPRHSCESCKSPWQMERENEMIGISYRLFVSLAKEERGRGLPCEAA